MPSGPATANGEEICAGAPQSGRGATRRQIYLMRIRATGGESHERSSHGKAKSRSTLLIRVLCMEELSRFVIREQNQLFRAGPLYVWVVGLHFKPKAVGCFG